MTFALFYVTNPDKETAKRIGNLLLEKRLCACFNIFPVESAYWFKGKIERANEWVLIVKTREELVKKVETAMRKAHPYKVPCIIKLAVSANKDYEDWLNDETKK